MNRLQILVLTLLIAGCTNEGYLPSKTSKAIDAELVANNFESINLTKFGGASWSRVCFLGPYNENSAKALGFNWQVSKHTEVLRSDGHNVIVFATKSEVIEYVVHSRGAGDFWQLSGECFNRNNSTFIKDPEGKYGHNYVHKNT